MQATIEELLGTMFPIRSVQSCYKEEFIWEQSVLVGRRGQYLHRSPANRRRRRKGKSRIWGSKIWSRVPRDSDPNMTALARTRSNCKRQIRPLARGSASHQQTRNCLTVIKIWLEAPDRCFIPRQTGWLTVGRNTRLRLSTQYRLVQRNTESRIKVTEE
jgi:hypothetical protein